MQQLSTHYDELQIDNNADLEVIRSAYRRLSQKHHPDKHSEENKAAAEMRMKAINRAYTVLSDPNRRREYDHWLSKTEKPHSYRTSSSANNNGNDRKDSEVNSTARLFDPTFRTPLINYGFFCRARNANQPSCACPSPCQSL